jgi:1-acyl-sn-glycerol-3-phosphate acyltransferase
MLRPTAEQLAPLSRFERTAFWVADQVNRRGMLKRASHAFLRTAGAGWVHACTNNILRVYQPENLSDLRPDRGVLFVVNHRSFFDLYVVACLALRRTRWIEAMYFPVRSDYFYERPDGIAVNAVMAAMAMYPPVFRDGTKRAFNQYSVDAIAELAQRPGTLVGFHPEGTRNKSRDPYALLPANPGVGQIVYCARPIVVPVFILGLSNDLPRQIRGNFDGTGEPITVVFGKPLELGTHYAQPARLRTYKNLADHLRDELSALGALERTLRARDGLPSLAPPVARASEASLGG